MSCEYHALQREAVYEGVNPSAGGSAELRDRIQAAQAARAAALERAAEAFKQRAIEQRDMIGRLAAKADESERAHYAVRALIDNPETLGIGDAVFLAALPDQLFENRPPAATNERRATIRKAVDAEIRRRDDAREAS